METHCARCVCPCVGEGLLEDELPCEPAGHVEIARGSVSSCSPFWRAFVRIYVAMEWIEDGYHLLWATKAPQQKEMENSSSSLDHREFVTNAVVEMVTEKMVTMLPPAEKPWVVSPLGVVRKPRKDQFRLFFPRALCVRDEAPWSQVTIKAPKI